MINKVFVKETTGFTWLDIINPNHEELQKVAKEYGLHATSLEDCLDPKHQPKYEELENVVFIIVRAYDENCPLDSDNVLQITRKVAIFIGQGFIITVHRCDMAFIKQLREKCQAKAELAEEYINYLLLELFKGVILSFAPAMEQLEESIEDFEKRLFSNEDTPLIIQSIHSFRSKVSVIRRIIRQSYDVIQKIEDYPVEIATLHQDVRERFERYLSLTEALREAANDILNTHISLASHRTNEVMRVLTILSVFFLPLTFIVGVYGMNFKNMPELNFNYGYPMAWALMIGITAGCFIWFKKKGWLK